LMEDEDGNVHLGHRGAMGGGKQGIGKAFFERNYEGEFSETKEDGKVTRIALIGALGSPDLVDKVGDFVHMIAALKSRQRSAAKGRKTGSATAAQVESVAPRKARFNIGDRIRHED